MSWKRLEFVTSSKSLDGCPQANLPEVAFAGRSNVGKSSLLNTIAGRKALAKVSGKPGKTRLLNFFDLDGRGHLVDLPGYGFAAVSKSIKAEWGRFMSEYLKNRPQLIGLVQLLDCRHEPSQQDKQMVAWLVANELPFFLALTKSDKISRGKRQKHQSMILKSLNLQTQVPLQFFSSETGEGKAELRAWVDGALEAGRVQMLR
ncbi:YihA family ribosome biogenesis GTP-binding protein [bacterium]|nr:YihA family ribosome biogenesis GTP-binding protein [bacterium]